MFFCRVLHFSRTLREVGYVYSRVRPTFFPSPTEPARSAGSAETCANFLSIPLFTSIPAKPLIATQI
jgi:hypothetical protein